ncbi:hypothetical protein roselon_00485 [Roseibacterium elongatum DSM 19469]|uniref:DUF4864 domain-containing protein n=1 Tax=Roseicyclus elongatus DSM 19469 TaxID=1294273 RepID=W8S2I2_9RHOB|nr:DUF4864 domain-containing protein [Roseibacterium elongatum]AHM02926.1 hypothetical protein roselon_00485 [Roseibacterium elongatum DSM 19469]
MLRAILAALTLGLATLSAQAQQVLDPNPEIESVIGGQFDAFRAEDVDTAWEFASPTIQRLFGTPENFAAMVEQGYPMVWTPGAVRFIDLQSLGRVLVQRVEVFDQAGRVHYLGYQMIQTDEGWRINGVQILEAPSVAA